jgi:excisionase family DNA binding protein
LYAASLSLIPQYDELIPGPKGLNVRGEVWRRDEMENLYSVEQAALKLGGISKATVQVWLSKGRLRRTKIGRRTMVSESELQRFIDGIPLAPQVRSQTEQVETTAVG